MGAVILPSPDAGTIHRSPDLVVRRRQDHSRGFVEATARLRRLEAEAGDRSIDLVLGVLDEGLVPDLQASIGEQAEPVLPKSAVLFVGRHEMGDPPRPRLLDLVQVGREHGVARIAVDPEEPGFGEHAGEEVDDQIESEGLVRHPVPGRADDVEHPEIGGGGSIEIR